jgi:hypothetical protein
MRHRLTRGHLRRRFVCITIFDRPAAHLAQRRASAIAVCPRAALRRRDGCMELLSPSQRGLSRTTEDARQSMNDHWRRTALVVYSIAALLLSFDAGCPNVVRAPNVLRPP